MSIPPEVCGVKWVFVDFSRRIKADFTDRVHMARHDRVRSSNGTRASIAAAAARLIVEDGIADFHLAKRKALARQLEFKSMSHSLITLKLRRSW